MSQAFDGYRVERDPNGRYWAEALARDANSVITSQGQPINATYYSALGRPDDGRPRRVGRHRALPAQRQRPVVAAAHGGRHAVGNGNVSWTATVSQARMARCSAAPGCSRCRSPGGRPAAARPS